MAKSLNQLLAEAKGKKTEVETDPDMDDLYTHEVNELHLEESASIINQLDSLKQIIEARSATLGESVSIEEAAITTGIKQYVNEMYEFLISHESLSNYVNNTAK